MLFASELAWIWQRDFVFVDEVLWRRTELARAPHAIARA
jgi:hypothetical protein